MFIMTVLTFIVSPGRAIETEMCKACHGYVKPLDSITKDCSICHDQQDHHDLPSRRDREFVHNQHSQYVFLTQKRCTICHKQNPDCTNCHNSHEIVRAVNLSAIQGARLNVTQNVSNISYCTNCHGGLPTPLGHADFRGALSKSKHQWMNCRTCHVNTYITGKGNNFGLHFKDLLTVQIEDSINLCKICHSFQYNKLKNKEHGNPGQKCVDCHNPHTTDFTGSKIITPKEATNISSQISSASNWITTKVPILQNTTVVLIIIIIVAMTVAEYFLSRDEEGKKTAYDTVKIRGNEDKLKTLEIKSKNQNIDIISEILETNGVNILGMTMTKEEDKDVNIYKYVIFVNIESPIDESVLIDKITDTYDVIRAIFTEGYEL